MNSIKTKERRKAFLTDIVFSSSVQAMPPHIYFPKEAFNVDSNKK